MRFNKTQFAVFISVLFLFLCICFPSNVLLAQSEKQTITTSDSAMSQMQTVLEQKIFALQKEVHELKYQLNVLTEKVNKLSTSSDESNSRPIPGTNNNSGTTSTPPPTSNKPSDNDIKNTLVEKFRKEVPATWAGSLMGGKNGVLSSIEILQFGNYNEQLKYWPVKIRVKGICDAEFIMTTEKRTFDKTGDFKFKQDDYGKWTADLEGF
jgi:uncharacterized coiled-coil protein SlyX